MKGRGNGKIRDYELIALCRGCLTFETLWFIGDSLVATRKFVQNGNGKVFHDCGSKEPCRLFPRYSVRPERV